MANPTLILRPAGSRNRAGLITPTLSGGVIEVPGAYGKAWQIAEATTNLYTNPRFVNAAAGQYTVGGNWTMDNDPEEVVDGYEALRITPTVADSALVSYTHAIGGLAIGDVITASIDIKKTRASQNVYIRFHDGAKYIDGGSVVVEETGGKWFRASITTPAIDATVNLAAVRFYLYHSGTVSLEEPIWVTKLQIETKPYATPFTDGSLGAGHAWTGTAHQSTSTRSHAYISIPQDVPIPVGTILARVAYTNRSSGTQTLLVNRFATNQRVYLGATSNRALQGSIGDTFPTLTTSDALFEYGATVGHGMTYGNNVARLYDASGLLEVAAHSTLSGSLASHSLGRTTGDAYHPNANVESVAMFDSILSDAEVAGILKQPEAWTWASLGGDLSTYAAPPYTSSVFLIEPRFYRANRINVISEEITPYVLDASIERDVARTGSKAQLSITLSDFEVAGAGDWIAAFLEVTPEVGDPSSNQRGLFQLDDPTVTMTGVGPAQAQATGSDPVRLFERSVTQVPQVSPKGTVVSREIQFAVEVASTGAWGPELVVNGDFEAWSSTSTPTGWSNSAYNGALTPSRAQRAFPATGKWAFQLGMGINSPVEATVYSYVSPRIDIDRGSGPYLLQAFIAPGSGYLKAWVGCEMWKDGTPAGSVSGYMVTLGTGGYDQWQRSWVVFTPPADIDQLVPTINIRAAQTWTDGQKYGTFDRVSLRRVTLPAMTHHSLPVITGATTTEIAHGAGTQWLTRINELCLAGAHHDLMALPDGRATTRRKKDPRTDTPIRSYTIGTDLRVVGDVQSVLSPTEFRNIVVAIKEDYESGTAMIAIARNDDPNHPWSTLNYGEVALPQPITVSDAVDQDALQDVADAELAKSSMQESVTLQVLPDPFLFLLDVIEVSGGSGPEAGRWAVETMREGLTSAEPLVSLEARRILTPAYPEGTS